MMLVDTCGLLACANDTLPKAALTALREEAPEGRVALSVAAWEIASKRPGKFRWPFHPWRHLTASASSCACGLLIWMRPLGVRRRPSPHITVTPRIG